MAEIERSAQNKQDNQARLVYEQEERPLVPKDKEVAERPYQNQQK